MSSSADRPAPRVGIIRGAVAVDQPVVADVRRNLPTEVLDPVAIEQVRADAATAGYEAGYAAGLARADQEAAAARAEHGRQLMGAMTALLGAVNQLRSREAATMHDLADQATALGLAIAEQVLQREVATAADPGREAIARALGLVPEDGDIRIRLHPADLDVLADLGDLSPGRDVQIVADPAVRSGDAVIQVAATRIDAQIGTALQRIREVLR